MYEDCWQDRGGDIMGLMQILFSHPMTSTAPDFLRTVPKDYGKIKNIAETILESQSASKEQRKIAMKRLNEANKAMK